MEEERWSVRSDVLLKVFLLLPLEDLLFIRSVCKPWHILIGSMEFLNLWSRQPQRAMQQSWICIRRWRRCNVNHRALITLASEAWCPLGDKHLKFPFTFHPPEASHFQLMATSQGLVFGRSFVGRSLMLHVGNPLRNLWRSVPLPFTTMGIHQAAMEVDVARGSYRIGLFGAVPFLVYDSRTDVWSNTSYYKVGTGIGKRLRGCMYMDKLPSSIICYDMNVKAWSEVEVGGFPDRTHQRLDIMVSSSMFNHNGRHIRASALLSDNNKLWYEIWELVPGGGVRSRMTWEILSTGMELDDIVLEGSFIFVKAADVIVVHPWFYSSKAPPAVAYNLKLDAWHVWELGFEGAFVPSYVTAP